MKKKVGGDIPIRYKIILKSFIRQIISRYSLKTNVNQQKNPYLPWKHTLFKNRTFFFV